MFTTAKTEKEKEKSPLAQSVLLGYKIMSSFGKYILLGGKRILRQEKIFCNTLVIWINYSLQQPFYKFRVVFYYIIKIRGALLIALLDSRVRIVQVRLIKT